jgi:phosphatidylcholine synthase
MAHRPPSLTDSDARFRNRAWLVHAYTSLGIACAILAAIAVIEHKAFSAYIAIGVAMLIDATDGILARRWHVKRWTPNFDGRKLDDLTDFLTYTFVPLLFAYTFELVSDWGILVLIIAGMASAYGFSNESAKTTDGFFTGFPSYWNAVVLYLFWLQWPEWLNEATILLFSILTFIPFRYVSLNETQLLRKTNRFLLVLWAAHLIYITTSFERPDVPVVYLSLWFPVYYFLFTAYIERTIHEL